MKFARKSLARIAATFRLRNRNNGEELQRHWGPAGTEKVSLLLRQVEQSQFAQRAWSRCDLCYWGSILWEQQAMWLCS